MYRTYLTLLLLAAMATSCASNKSTYNLDFEEVNKTTGLPSGWGLGNVEAADVPADTTVKEYTLDDKIKHHGKYSLCISWHGQLEGWTASNYIIKKRFTGKRIKLTGWLKTENVFGSAGLWMRIDGESGVLAFDNMESRPVKGTADWKQYSIELDYDEQQARQTVVGGLLEGSGKIWMDELTVAIDGQEISKAAAYASHYKAEIDTAFRTTSGIQAIALDSAKIQRLTELGMLWGFIKYYHANVNAGNYNMDAELFRVLPKVLAASDASVTNKVLNNWVDVFGKPASCPGCADIAQAPPETKLLPDFGNLFIDGNLPATLVGKLEDIRRNRLAKGVHYYIEMERGVGNPRFKNELAYDVAYPDAGLRLLALYRYWNMVQYFFPDKDIIGENWNEVLTEFIPVFCNARNALEYQLACKKLIARINDTHADLWSGGDEIDKMRKDLYLPFGLGFIENKLVVTAIDDRVKDKLQVGAVIEQIDDIRVDSLVRRWQPLTPASNYETQLRNLADARGFLFAGKEGDVRLAVDNLGLKYDVTVQRSRNFKATYFNEQHEVAYKMLNDGIGYIYPALLKEQDLHDLKQRLGTSRGIIIDMRCYPDFVAAFALADWFNEQPTGFVKFTFGSTDMPGMFTVQDGPTIGGKAGEHYKGKIVIIVNEETQSRAEYVTMALSATPGAAVLGSTTAGADGNVSSITLPGGLGTYFSGIGILYPDGTETQRKGVKIDRIIKPTIRGIREGRDEQLEAAIKIIKGQN